MKKHITLALACLLMAACLAGCRNAAPEPLPATLPATAPSATVTPLDTAKTSSARILQNIWNCYGQKERFSVCGGTSENVVTGGPGDLNMAATEELTTRYLLKRTCLPYILDGASLTHLLSDRLFTAVVIRMAEGTDLQAIAKQHRIHLQNHLWSTEKPEDLLIAMPEKDHLLLAFGSTAAIETLRGKLSGAYADGDVLYHESIAA